METGKNNATNNFIIRIWSKHHYKDNKERYRLNYYGSVQDVQRKEIKHFNTPGKLLRVLEEFNKKSEKWRRAK